MNGLFAFYWRTAIRPNPRPAFALATLMVLSALLQMIAIGLAVPLLEGARNTNSNGGSWVLDYFRSALTPMGLQAEGPVLVFAILVFASLLFLLHSGFMFLHQYYAARTAEQMRQDMKSRMFESFLAGQYSVVSQRGRGAILQDLTGPPYAVYTAVIRLSTLFAAVFTSAALIFLMLYLSWWATVLIAALALGGIYATRRIVDAKARKSGQMIHELQSEQSHVAVDAIDGLAVVKSHGLEQLMSGRFRALLQTEFNPAVQVARYRYLPNFINECAGIGVVLILGAISLLSPASGMSFPTLVGFLVAIRQCANSTASINALLAELQALRKSVEIVSEVLSEIPAEVSGNRSTSGVNEIRLVNVALRYESRGEVLHGVDLVMERGSVTAVVGPTGSGKSSIANLLVGLYRPTSGRILVDGVDLAELDLSAWRKRVGYVSQDTILFNASIRDNIALWNDSFKSEAIEEAARLAQLHDFVAGLPEGYDTQVGDRGLRLSGGQCQRVAIARAILMRPAVLVLDEATSALDNLTEKAVYEAIAALRANSIVVAIAHRLSTIKDADRIVVLESGHVVETGTHSSLIVEGGSYSRLYETESVE